MDVTCKTHLGQMAVQLPWLVNMASIVCDMNWWLNCRVSALQSVVAGLISSGGDHGIHSWWDQIRLKQLSSVVVCRCLPYFLVMVIQFTILFLYLKKENVDVVEISTRHPIKLLIIFLLLHKFLWKFVWYLDPMDIRIHIQFYNNFPPKKCYKQNFVFEGGNNYKTVLKICI